VAVDEPHLAATLAAAEWTPAEAGRRLGRTGGPTVVEAVRQHADGTRHARELRSLAG
jgi:hypothetical protein